MPQRSRVNPKPYLNCIIINCDDNVYHKKSIDYNGKVSSCPHSCVVLDGGYQLTDVVWWGGSSHHVEDKLLPCFDILYCQFIVTDQTFYIYRLQNSSKRQECVQKDVLIGFCSVILIQNLTFSNSVEVLKHTDSITERAYKSL